MISNYWVNMNGRLMNHRPRIVLSGSPFSCTLPKKARPVLAHGQESIEVVLWGKTFPSFHSFPCALLLLFKGSLPLSLFPLLPLLSTGIVPFLLFFIPSALQSPTVCQVALPKIPAGYGLAFFPFLPLLHFFTSHGYLKAY